MQTLLAVLDHIGTAPAVLAAADLVARRRPAVRIEALHIRPLADPSFMPTEEVMTPARQTQFEAMRAARAEQLHGMFEQWRETRHQPKATWREEQGAEAEIMVRNAGEADLVVIGRAPRVDPGDGHTAAEAVLFASAAPLLLVPATVPTALGAHIAVAWKPSAVVERAVAAAAPLLWQAKQVTVIIGLDGAPEGEQPEMRVRDLAALERVPEVLRFEVGEDAIGPALLREARAAGADLLVMGAYGHRRSMEMLVGGVTREILAGADLPVLMHH